MCSKEVFVMGFDWGSLEYVLRMVIAGLCGIFIGLERRNRSKEAGIRTHFVVACAAAMMMIVSKYAFFDVVDMYEAADVRLDPSRVASTIASGIGFLGAGMIFVHKNTVTGLTTAAGIWATSGVGMAIGSGMYMIGISGTVLIIIAQVILHMNFKWMRNTKLKKLKIYDVTEEGYQAKVTQLFNDNNINIHEVSVTKTEEGKTYSFIIEMPHTICEEDIISHISYRCGISTNH